MCAWVALAPWLVLLTRLPRGREAFGWSWAIGFLFFLGSIWWLVKLSAFGGAMAYVGWVVLCAYLALYFGAFGYVVHRFGLLTSSFGLLFIPAAWVALEYTRSHALSGFGWNLLGYSQAPTLSLIQFADLTGVWGVSFLLVMGNAAIASFVLAKPPRAAKLPALVTLICVLAAGAYGHERLKLPAAGPTVRVSVVQGNIPQEEKWDETHQSAILEQYARLTAQAAAAKPGLIIWPETAVPGLFGIDPALTARIQEIAARGRIPILVGAPMGRSERGAWRMTNSAALLDGNGSIIGRYDKLHLVPFGEFVPGESWLPWLREALPPIGEFVPGKDYTMFQVQGLNLSVLICFEDIFPDLARQFVRRGAQMLVTITNDAWFGPTAAAYQHAQASTLRAVELRRPMIRAANTGWSGCIDATGKWQSSVRDAAGQELFVDGVATCEVSPSTATTLYARWGDWLAWMCLFGVGYWGLLHLRLRRSRR